MQTFLPFPSFEDSFKALDYRRLGKQRVETKQLLQVYFDPSKKGWKNHPARLMWVGHEARLCSYGVLCCAEWKRRGYVDNLMPWFVEKFHILWSSTKTFMYPSWFGDEAFHRSHQSNLLRKGQERFEKTGNSDVLDRYKALWPNVPFDLPYIWPKPMVPA